MKYRTRNKGKRFRSPGKWVANARGKNPLRIGNGKNPLRIDPTRTGLLRSKFAASLKRQFARLRAAVRKLVLDDDAFGLKGKTPLVGNFDPDQPRDADGRFSSGTAGDVRKETVLQSAARLARSLPAAAVAKVKAQVKAKYAKLEARYGPRYAKAIIGAALVGIPVPLPGASFAAAAPVLAVAELHRLVGSRVANAGDGFPEMTEDEIREAADELVKELVREFSYPLSNADWRFNTSPEKLKQFRDWLKTQFGSLVRGKTEDELWRLYLQEGFRRGAGRSYEDVTGRYPEPDKLDFYRGSKDQFLRSAFARPETRDKVELLVSRTFEELDGMTQETGTRMARVLADGLTQGKNPRDVARDLDDQLDVGLNRALTIARTEIIRAHAEGQLTALEQMGVEEVGVAVEWATAGDEKVCPLCEPLEGIVLKLDEAKGLLPRHPNCRCAFLPANVGETPTEDRKDTAASVRAAVKESEQLGDDGWGPDRIAKARPRDATRNALDRFSRWLAVNRSFFADCLRDEAGRCLPEVGGVPVVSNHELRKARTLAIEKAKAAPVPTPAEVAENNRKIDQMGADRFESTARGNSKDRAASRKRLLAEFGNGTHCPCVYCGVKLEDKTLTRDKIYTAREGGKYRHNNLIPACLGCNKSRGDVPFKKIRWK